MPVINVQTDWQKLAASDLGIVRYTLTNLLEDLKISGRLIALNKWLSDIPDEDFYQVLKTFNSVWFNPADPGQRYLFSDENNDDVILQLKLFRMSDQTTCSLTEVQVNKRLVIHRKSTFAIKDELECLGFITTTSDVSEYVNIYQIY